MNTVYRKLSRITMLSTVGLILCAETVCSAKWTGITIPRQPDSLKLIEPKPIRLTEAGARMVLKERADLITLRQVVSVKDTLLFAQSRVIAAQRSTITSLNQQQQASLNNGQVQKEQADHYRRKLRGARLENWIVRGVALLYVAVRLKLI